MIHVRAYQGGVLVLELWARSVVGIDTDGGGWNLVAVINARLTHVFPMGRCAMAFELEARP